MPRTIRKRWYRQKPCQSLYFSVEHSSQFTCKCFYEHYQYLALNVSICFLPNGVCLVWRLLSCPQTTWPSFFIFVKLSTLFVYFWLELLSMPSSITMRPLNMRSFREELQMLSHLVRHCVHLTLLAFFSYHHPTVALQVKTQQYFRKHNIQKTQH